MRNFAPLLAALLPVLAACAAPPPGPVPAQPWREARVCRAERAPVALPTADQLVDQRALGAEAARLWAGTGGHVLFTLLYDRGGTNVRRDVVESTVPDEVADSLQRLVFAHRRQAGPARGEWGVRLRVELGAEPAFAVARREVCTPVPSTRGERMAMVDPLAGAAVEAEMVWVRVSLDARGLVTDARLERGALHAVSETRLLSYVRAISFLPALEDGRPVPGETTIPVRLGR